MVRGSLQKTRERIDKLEKDIEPIKSKETEPEEKSAPKIAEEFDLGSDSLKVLKALTNSKYSWRTMRGLESETKFESSKLAGVLQELEEKSLASSSKSSAGKTIWGATMRGYILVSLNESST